MIRYIAASAAVLALLGLWAVPPLNGQDAAVNGNFELQDRGPWSLTGSNSHAEMALFDVDNDLVISWCWEREPGTNGGNGGLADQTKPASHDHRWIGGGNHRSDPGLYRRKQYDLVLSTQCSVLRGKYSVLSV